MDILFLGGASFSAQPIRSYAFLPSGRGAFSAFHSSSAVGLALHPVQLLFSPLDPAIAPSAGERYVWDACPDTKVFRDGAHLVLKTFHEGAEHGLECRSRFSDDAEMIHVDVKSFTDAEKCQFLPGLDVYPHLRFLLAWQLARLQGLWLHATAALRNGKMYIFTGRSGRGKSTLSKLLHASGQFEIASDEKNILRKTPEGFMAFGTPWTSSARLSSNISAPLAGIFFLDHAKENTFQPMAPGAVLKKIIPQVHIPWFDEPRTQLILQTAETLVETVPSWMLAFRPDQEVVERLMDFVDGR